MRFLRETFVVFHRQLRLSLANPTWMIISILQPILYLTLFGPLLQQVALTPGFPQGDSWSVFVPGLLVQLGIFGSAFVGFAIIAEWRSGVIDRMLVTPASRWALIGGRVLHDMLLVMVQGAILVAAAMLMGLRAPFAVIVIGLVLVGLLGAAFSALSYGAALSLKSENAFAPLTNMFALPILLLSGILLPMSLAPAWLQIASDFNPIKHVVEGLRAVYRGEILAPETLLGFAIAIAFVVLGAWIGAAVFRAQTK
ncbi:ABC transporter permease [Pelagibacterium lacus]|uniref:Transport permease protein n=1 Tax=Pelagibacterium lacus TaxID=2282655 RepID=A0A369W7G5_9HYPH|nr:ABC transporter permease [Pelagibacterium lacus]RDE10634.1 ABC transporter permease [Pelagibacterium lacus]